MHHLDELMLRNAVVTLEKALADLKEGGFKGELLAALRVACAITDINGVLKTQPAKAED